MKLATAFFALATAAVVSASALTGCAADTSAEDAADDTEETSDELSAAGKKLIGSYVDDTGAFRGLVLTSEKVGQGNKFFADVDTGIRCITTPCPSSERIEGTFTAGAKTITFKSSTANHGKHLLGKYNYLVQGSKFSLFRKDFAQSLSKENSYCSQSNDCYRQNIIHPMCLGGFSCTAANTCAWSCGFVPPPLDPCKGKDEASCQASSGICQPVYGPSACSPDGRICTADMAYKGCEKKSPPPTGAVCLSSDSCAAGTHCSVDDGVCNPYGMLAVCAGTCVAGSK